MKQPTRRRAARRPAPVTSAPATSGPAATVAICTYDRYDMLARSVARLQQQSLPVDRFEILVVDNTPDPARSAEAAEAYAGVENLRWMHVDKPGLSNARNVASAEARAPIIVYLDDDAFAAPDWLERMLAAYEVLGDGVVGIGGRVLPHFTSPAPDWLGPAMLPYLSVLDLGGEVRPLQPGEWVVGANVSYRVAKLHQAGGFSPALGRIGSGISLMSNDETELAARLEALGGAIGYTPHAVVEHCIDPSRLSQEWMRRRIAWQAVSDFVRAPQETRAEIDTHWHDLKIFLAHQPPHLRTMRALALPQGSAG
ncbi:glycosyltransferase family 2 protein, partial [Belnapia rosea]